MWNTPEQKRLDKIPRIYETEDIPVKEKRIHLHFFIGGSDWYAVEFNGEDIFFGFVILNGDLEQSEWGYFSFAELKAIRVGAIEVDCELDEFWEIRPAKDVELIRKARGWNDEKEIGPEKEA